MANKGISISGEKSKELWQKKHLAQEQLAESSFHENCYVSLATVKRAECPQSASNRILKNICIFFGITPDELIDSKSAIKDIEQGKIPEELSSLLDKHGNDDEIKALLNQYIN